MFSGTPRPVNLWLVWDRLEIRVEDRALGIEGLAVTVAVGCRVEAARVFILAFLTSSVISNCSA